MNAVLNPPMARAVCPLILNPDSSPPFAQGASEPLTAETPKH
jgi:hypothetical protein